MDFCIHAIDSENCELDFPCDCCGDNCCYCTPYDEWYGNMGDFDYDFIIDMH